MKRYIRSSNYIPDAELTGRGIAYASSWEYVLHELSLKVQWALHDYLKTHLDRYDLTAKLEYPTRDTLRVIITDDTNWDQHRAKLESIDEDHSFDAISNEESLALDHFSYWIKEANRAQIPISNLSDYLASRTIDNPRSGYYQSKEYAKLLDTLEGLLSKIRDYSVLMKLVSKALRVSKRLRTLYRERLSKAYKTPYEGETIYDEIFDVSDYVYEVEHGDETAALDAIDEIKEEILADVKRSLK